VVVGSPTFSSNPGNAQRQLAKLIGFSKDDVDHGRQEDAGEFLLKLLAFLNSK